MILCSPFLLGWTALVALGGFSAILVIAGCVWLLLWFSPSNLLSALQFMAFFVNCRQRSDDRVTVRYFRVREENGTEVAIRVKGTLTRGNIGAGDRVVCYGRWRNGVLLLKRGFNRNTNSSVELAGSIWPVALLITLAVILIGGAWLCALSQQFLHSLNATPVPTIRY